MLFYQTWSSYEFQQYSYNSYWELWEEKDYTFHDLCIASKVNLFHNNSFGMNPWPLFTLQIQALNLQLHEINWYFTLDEDGSNIIIFTSDRFVTSLNNYISLRYGECKQGRLLDSVNDQKSYKSLFLLESLVVEKDMSWYDIQEIQEVICILLYTSCNVVLYVCDSQGTPVTDSVFGAVN